MSGDQKLFTHGDLIDLVKDYVDTTQGIRTLKLRLSNGPSSSIHYHTNSSRWVIVDLTVEQRIKIFSRLFNEVHGISSSFSSLTIESSLNEMTPKFKGEFYIVKK